MGAGPQPVAGGEGPVQHGGRPGVGIGAGFGGRKAHRPFRQVEPGNAAGGVWRSALGIGLLGASAVRHGQQHDQRQGRGQCQGATRQLGKTREADRKSG